MKTKTKGRAREGWGGPGRAGEGQGGPGRASNHEQEFHWSKKHKFYQTLKKFKVLINSEPSNPGPINWFGPKICAVLERIKYNR